MYYIIDSETGNRHPCAVAPRATIRNLREVFSMLDKGAEPCVAHVVFPTGETLDVKVPLRYRLNNAVVFGSGNHGRCLHQDH